jgi:putative transposase
VLAMSLLSDYRVSIHRACQVVMFHRSAWYYKRKGEKRDLLLRTRMREIAQTRVRYGMWRIYTLLRREGWPDNHKRVHRLYKLEGLNLRSKRPRRNRAAAHRLDPMPASKLHACWSMDFVADQLFNGRKFRSLTLVDNYSRQCLAIEVDQGIKAEQVVAVMERLKAQHGTLPERIKVDNGSEFISKALDKWAYDNHVILDFSRLGKPTDNPFIESFNGSFRDECLNVHWFLCLEDAREKIETWRHEYNTFRPHSSLEDMTPDEWTKSTMQKSGFSTLALS